jgi:spermidine synthase
LATFKNKVNNSQWFKEWFTPHESHVHRIKRFIVRKQTAFQSAIVAESHSFGKCLILDGEMQSSQNDEFIYHEVLVHPALMGHPNPKNILILGGGEGATVRELLKHKTVTKVTMVDIDGEVIEFCKKYLYPWHQGAFNSPRCKLVVGDAKKFIEEQDEKFDVIISDLPSPIEGGPAYQLYTIEFYHDLIKRLNKGGVFVMQAGSGNLLQIELHQVLYSTLKHIFKIVRPCYAYVPSFDVPWAYLIASDSADPFKLTQKKADQIIKKRVRGPLKFYDGIAHVGLFHIPKYLRTLLSREKRLITKAKPIYFYK